MWRERVFPWKTALAAGWRGGWSRGGCAELPKVAERPAMAETWSGLRWDPIWIFPTRSRRWLLRGHGWDVGGCRMWNGPVRLSHGGGGLWVSFEQYECERVCERVHVCTRVWMCNFQKVITEGHTRQESQKLGRNRSHWRKKAVLWMDLPDRCLWRPVPVGVRPGRGQQKTPLASRRQGEQTPEAKGH